MQYFNAVSTSSKKRIFQQMSNGADSSIDINGGSPRPKPAALVSPKTLLHLARQSLSKTFGDESETIVIKTEDSNTPYKRLKTQ